MSQLQLSARAYHRILKLARTIADLAGSEVMTARVLLADDHAILRSGLRLLLTTQNEFDVVGEAASGTETLTLAEQLQPDLILLDLNMPALGGLDALPALRKLVPSARILILTMHDDPQYLRQALKNGASGYGPQKSRRFGIALCHAGSPARRSFCPPFHDAHSVGRHASRSAIHKPEQLMGKSKRA